MSKYNQLCVWPGTVVGEDQIKKFEDHFKNQGWRVKYMEEVETKPDVENGKVVDDTGGRNDLLFYIHDDDIGKFAVPRLSMGIRWWEDVVSYNDNSHLYTDKILNKYKIEW
jgi:hypothetical protein